MTIKFRSVELKCQDCDMSGNNTVYRGGLEVRGDRISDRIQLIPFWARGKCAVEAGAHHATSGWNKHGMYDIYSGGKYIGELTANSGGDVDMKVDNLSYDNQILALDDKVHKL